MILNVLLTILFLSIASALITTIATIGIDWISELIEFNRGKCRSCKCRYKAIGFTKSSNKPCMYICPKCEKIVFVFFKHKSINIYNKGGLQIK